MLTSAEEFNAACEGRFPGVLGFEAVKSEVGSVSARMTITPDNLAPNGYLHAGAVVTFADTACGLGARGVLPEGATGFTTLELKSNHLSTAREGTLEVEATAAHAGRTTQVWDAVVTHVESGRKIALFRCTQAVLWK
ncbi:uncharacterized protein (TIGR00369 family) [Antricoccus suffuscus]|uniref:Uncharacterized protein (TIGR00369 family) n=2 Tax=Bacteria TaxID=2 RepID=A0A2T1A356_9ACTN|nr:PaaI family thioesterase [Antricoccus suffuscus]PRZ42974.1 uncharacterized protein (TIGR00369 family) [Antricoccus suffuscus]